MMETGNLELAAIMPVLNQNQELSGSCNSFVLNHVKREANMAAHRLAKFAFTFAECTWICQVPDQM